MSKLILLSLAAASCALAATSSDQYAANTFNATQLMLNDWYDGNDGQIDDDAFWQNGPAHTYLADLMSYYPDQTSTIPQIFSTLYSGAADKGGFIDGFYDDEGWWALNWIAAYDVTKEEKYLQKAADIWWDMKGGWRNGSNTCGGGMWWDKAHTEMSAIPQELFISVSAHLANRVPQNKTMYVEWAEAGWEWFAGSGMVNKTGGLVNDSYNFTTCRVDHTSVLSYTQGVILGGLIELNRVAPSPDLLSNATAIADATLASSRFNTKDGIFSEPVGGFTSDSEEFKGVFLRNLRLLQEVAPKQSYVDFVTRNADSIWSTARFSNGTIGPFWDSQKAPPTFESHNSALNCLLAAAVMTTNSTRSVVTK